MSCLQRACIFPATANGLCSNHARFFEESLPASLKELEHVIERGMKVFLVVANALSDIYEKRLYEQAGFATYRDYCLSRWGLGVSTAYNYLRAKAVVDALPAEKAETVSYSQAVQLARLPAEQREEHIRSTNFRVTSVRSLHAHKLPSKNTYLLAQLSKFCKLHPEMDFWSALECWQSSATT